MVFVGLLALLLGGCASVTSTADFYFPTTAEVRPPKPKDFPVPILGKAPTRPHVVIGRLTFRSDLGWKFMRESMIYNARVNGADAVILRSAKSKDELRFMDVPPRIDWMPISSPVYVQRQNGRTTYYNSGSTFIPIFQPGYTRRWVDTVIGIDAEMIVFRGDKKN